MPIDNSIFLFPFRWNGVLYIVHRVSDDKYRFSPNNGRTYTVPSWKDECRKISGGEVDYK